LKARQSLILPAFRNGTPLAKWFGGGQKKSAVKTKREGKLK
jgi:hypothetical protein